VGRCGSTAFERLLRQVRGTDLVQKMLPRRKAEPNSRDREGWPSGVRLGFVGGGVDEVRTNGANEKNASA